MTQLVVIINGPAGVGKSTVAPRVAARATNAACIVGDELRRFVVSRAEPPTVQLGLAYMGTAALTDVFLAAGYDLVVIDFVFEQPRHIERYTRALQTPVQIVALTLWAPLDVVRERYERRDRPGAQRDNATRSWHTIAANLPNLGTTIQANGTIEQTLTAITDHIDRRADP